MSLQTLRLHLTVLSPDYLQAIHQLHSLPAVDEFNTLGIPESIETTEQLLLEWTGRQKANSLYVYCMELKSTQAFIGLIGLNMGKPNYRSAEIWYKTHPTYWGKGYTIEALQEVLKLGFGTLQLHRIEAGCAVGNMASIRVLEKAGFTREGRKREILPIRGQWVDNYFYSILEKEFIQ